jgi:AcrR family transcriptional regulator
MRKARQNKGRSSGVRDKIGAQPVVAERTKQPSLREEHKLVTRSRIRRYARQCFARDGVQDVTLEMIALEAGIGRTTLYQYYPSKPVLVIDLMEQSLRATDRIYQHLARLEPFDLDGVIRWLTGYLAEVRDNASSLDMFHVEMGQDARVRSLLRGHWKRATAILGQRFPAFDLAGLSGAELVRRTYAAEALISEIGEFCGAASLDDYHLDRAVVIEVLASRIFTALLGG